MYLRYKLRRARRKITFHFNSKKSQFIKYRIKHLDKNNNAFKFSSLYPEKYCHSLNHSVNILKAKEFPGTIHMIRVTQGTKKRKSLALMELSL